eukprot:TRINITY_DN4999_c0_g1_i1.p1 TRINITY_DN4999_c0_g1~~TRINITY_DN4999_c0_g1_i1.p1  ORF type:complete len:257 (-),score=29.57 TRINITY_DN4999_c0_g1_i1:208-918(-)
MGDISQDTLAQLLGNLQGEERDLALARLIQDQENALMSAINVPQDAQPPLAHNLSDKELAVQLQIQEDQERERELVMLMREQQQQQQQQYNSELLQMQESVNPDNMTYEELTALGEVIGTVNKGLSQQQLNQLSCGRAGLGEFRGVGVKICSDKNNNNNKNQSDNNSSEECTVCRMEYESRQELIKLPCGHYYHSQCIRRWLESNKICPVCQKEVSVQQKRGSRSGGQSSSTHFHF